jgi:hypothetical protein
VCHYFFSSVVLRARVTNVPPRYSDGAQTGMPNYPSSPDPGPGIPGLTNITGTTTLTPLVPGAAPNATLAVSVSFLFQPIANGANLAFLNNTSYQPLKGTTTLLQVQRNPSGYAPLGGGVGAGGQLLLTEDSIQVVDLIVVRVLLPVVLCPTLLRPTKRTTWITEITRSTCTAIAPGCTCTITIGVFAAMTIADLLLHDDEPEWAQEAEIVPGRPLTHRLPSAAIQSSYLRIAGWFCALLRIIVSSPFFLGIT